MEQAELRYLHSPDLLDLEHGSPSDPEDFCILVQAMVGPRDEPGEESFDFLVCSPKGLAGELQRDPYVFGRHYLFLPRYDYHTMRQAITDLLDRTTGPDWDAVATRLARYGKWEFEDYNEHAPQVQEAAARE